MNTSTQVRARRDFRAMGRRRRHAARLFSTGKTQAEVARSLKVTRQSVSRWYQQFRRGGVRALKGAGREPRLDDRQRERLDTALREGPQAHGFPTDLWTLPRVARVIRRLTGVQYHPGHAWRILRHLGWTREPTRPAGTRARRGANSPVALHALARA